MASFFNIFASPSATFCNELYTCFNFRENINNHFVSLKTYCWPIRYANINVKHLYGMKYNIDTNNFLVLYTMNVDYNY